MIGLSSVDAFTIASALLKAAEYGAVLLAMGGVLFCIVFARRAEADVMRLARRIAVIAALVGLALLAARFGLRAARISGLGWAGAVDPVMLGLVWQSPLGDAALWRALGEGAILAVLLPGAGRIVAFGGVLAVAWSHAQVGHSLGAPRWGLAALLTAHVLAVAFWVGALAPLHRAARGPEGAALLHRFGIVAGWGVALLTVAGVGLAWLLVGSLGGLIGTVYGLGLLAKVALVCGLLCLAALNRWRLVPGLQAGRPGAATTLRRSIALEGAVVALILIATAAITTATTPPVNF